MVKASEIAALLPQTQCGECNFPGCKPYAEALAQKAAPIDACPPGGVNTLRALGKLLQENPEPYVQGMEAKTRPPALALIREDECIGCTKCIQACPVDAIIGSAKHMHSIITHECTGCGLCLDPCPVDCIELNPLTEHAYCRDTARDHYEARETRMLKEKQQKEAQYQEQRLLAQKTKDATLERAAKNTYIQQALARVKAKNSE